MPFEVDGITYDPCKSSVPIHVREMIELINPHGDEFEEQCPLCNVDEPVERWHHVVTEGMRWSPDYPIIRFTSEGLQTEEMVNS